MTSIGTWIIHGPIDLRASLREIGKARGQELIESGQLAKIEADALGSGWKWGYDWAPIIKWALDGAKGNPPRPRGRPQKSLRTDGRMPD